MKEIIFGANCVKAALQSNRRNIFKLLAYDNKETQKRNLDDLIQLARHRQVPIQYTTRIELDRYTSGGLHQNIALEVSKFEPPVLSEVPKVAGLWLVLARLLDPQNLGSIIRSAAFFGAAGVLTSIKGGCDFTPIVSKASAGTMETFDSLYRVKSISSFLQNSKINCGAHIIGTGLSRNGTKGIEDETKNRPIILLLGNEGTGLPEELLDLCDANVVIGGVKSVDSLNVSVAAGILLDRLTYRPPVNTSYID